MDKAPYIMVDGSNSVTNAGSTLDFDKPIHRSVRRITGAEWVQLRSAGPLVVATDGGDHYFWAWNGSIVVFQPDPRVQVTWSVTKHNLSVGGPEPTVTLTRNDTVTGWKNLVMDSGHVLRVRFVSGVATLTIKTDKPTTYLLNNCKEFNMTNRLRVRVLSVNEIYGI